MNRLRRTALWVVLALYYLARWLRMLGLAR